MIDPLVSDLLIDYLVKNISTNIWLILRICGAKGAKRSMSKAQRPKEDKNRLSKYFLKGNHYLLEGI